MSKSQILALCILVPFSALSVYAVMQVGYFGIFEYHIHSPAGWQVFTDLVIALVLVLSWLIHHARTNGRNPVPWVVLTLLLGSFGPLLYLLFFGISNKVAQERQAAGRTTAQNGA